MFLFQAQQRRVRLGQRCERRCKRPPNVLEASCGQLDCGVMASPKTKSPLPKRALCQKALRPEEPRSKHAKHPPPSFQRCSTYTQQWFTLKGGASRPPGQFPAEDNERSVAVSIPDGKPPAEGWPVILYPSSLMEYLMGISDGRQAG